MRGVLLAALLALLSVPQARALWLGRLNPNQLLGSWYVLAKASGEKDFAVEKATKNIEGVVVTLTPENNLKMLSSRHRLERCDLNVVELLRQASGWVFENPASSGPAGRAHASGRGRGDAVLTSPRGRFCPSAGRGGVPGAEHQLQGLRRRLHPAGVR
ncbi:epididymal-specific lipocalin-6 isoform X5 [Equus caballus]|uniref:epididymal-specific lipocalin-6 isoform X5 n=1 Tax=Equus caballus TaxID=9796 RepID=UPI0038B2FB72